MRSFTLAALAAAAVSAQSTERFNISVDGQVVTTYTTSQPWSSLDINESSGTPSSVTIPTNNNMSLMRTTSSASSFFHHKLAGSGVTYTVDLSEQACGCVAGIYAVEQVNGGWCGNTESTNGSVPQCKSFDIMQANKMGFNSGANPCSNGTCDAVSQCQYNMTVQGREKYGTNAYGPGGSKINTDLPFEVEQQYYTTVDGDELWKMKTVMMQGGRVLELEADCSGYIASMTRLSDFGFTFGNWDNRSEAALDFEWATGDCPQPVSPCYGAEATISNFALLGNDIFLEDMGDNGNDDGGNDGDDFGPAEWGMFWGWTDYFGEASFYVKGLDGQYLETSERGFEMGTNNRAFVMWTEEESAASAYHEVYIAGSLSVDIELYDQGCDQAVGMFLVNLYEQGCSLEERESANDRPMCQTVDLMVANKWGFEAAPHPDGDDGNTECMQRFAEGEYGAGSAYTIDTDYAFTVMTKFFAITEEGDEDWEYDLSRIETTLTQGGNSIVMNQDCPEYLEPFANSLYLGVSLGFSSYENAFGAIVDQCDDNVDAADADAPFAFSASNFSWTNNDAMEDDADDQDDDEDDNEPAYEVIGDVSFSVNDCIVGCHQCHDAWMSDDASFVYQQCLDERPMRFGRICSATANKDLCNPGDDHCVKSYPYGDPRRMYSDEAACRSLPDTYLDESEMKFGQKACKSLNGLCPTCNFAQSCNWSYRADDADKWAGATAMCRCRFQDD